MTLRRLPAESARPRPSRSLTPAEYEQGGRLEPLKDAGPCAASLNPGLEPIGSPLLPICSLQGFAPIGSCPTEASDQSEVDRVFEADPADMWMAEFYAGVGTRLRSFVETQRDLLDPAVADVLEAALAQDMRSYYETVFRRYALRDEMRRFFERYDLLLSPTLPISSLETGRDIPAELSDRGLVTWVFYTYPFNLTGQPAASVCAGIASNGMPVGLQIVGRALGEADVIRGAAGIERIHPPGYNLKRPRV